MSDLKNPMRFSISHRKVDIENYLRHEDFENKHVTELEICPSEGQVYVYWDSDKNE